MNTALYFDDLTVGDTFTTPGRTITEADVVMYCALSGDYNELHTNEEYAKRQEPFGQRIAAGLLGRVVLSGLINRLGIFEGSVIANLELRQWRFLSPILFNDTLHGTIRIAEMKPTKDGRRGRVDLAIELLNQRGEVVQTGTQRLLLARSRSTGT